MRRLGPCVEIGAATVRRRRPGLVLGTAALGFACLGWGLWIPAKAALAQGLIAHAWSEALRGESRPKPWPWADTWPVAKLGAPRLGKEVFVLAHASGQALAFGPAHVASSAAPGQSDNVVFAGHRDTHFAFLRELQEGDDLELESKAGVTHYRVTRMHVVHESATEVLERSGQAELTLITCFPFDAIVPGGPLRYVVHASRVEPAQVAGGDGLARLSRDEKFQREEK